jgi:hypothetical protein
LSIWRERQRTCAAPLGRGANVWPTPEIFLTDYSTPLMKQLGSETELELFS